MIIKKLLPLVCVVVSIAPALVVAAALQHEIDHLLSFVERSECQLERNGSKHPGKEAVVHIKNKYNHFKNEITTAEEFIELSASKSTMTGKAYMVYCPGQPAITSQQWLLAELQNYRKK